MGLILMKILQSCRACCCIVVIRPRVPSYCQQINCDMARGVQHSGFSQPTRPPTPLFLSPLAIFLTLPPVLDSSWQFALIVNNLKRN